jgi:hypothetical protein
MLEQQHQHRMLEDFGVAACMISVPIIHMRTEKLSAVPLVR